MRHRLIGRDFFYSSTLADFTPLARIFFQGLVCCADREGRLRDQPRRLRAEILPYDDLDADAAIEEFSEADMIRRYTVNGRKYLQILHFLEYQKPHHKERESLIPPPPNDNASPEVAQPKHESSTNQARPKNTPKKKEATSKDGASSRLDKSPNPPDTDTDTDTVSPPYSPPSGGTSENEPKKTARFRPPTVEEVRAYCEERGNGIDPIEFHAHYEAKGWKIGKTPMKSWQAAVITWERTRAKERTKQHAGAESAGGGVPWHIDEVKEHSNSPAWNAYFSEMEGLHGTHGPKWPRFESWLKERKKHTG